MRELLERPYFIVCLILGRLLRAGRYSRTRIINRDGDLQVQKQRLAYAPLLVWMGGVLVRMLNTGVQVLPQREWEARERELYRAIHEAEIRIGADGTLSLPCFSGVTLAGLLENPELDSSGRREAIELAAIALADFHARGFTHGDAMADNILVDLDAGVARWFDFETLHDASRSMEWRRADDLRALLATCLLRTFPDEVAGTCQLILDAYADETIAGLLPEFFASALQRPLPFHLGQAPISFQLFREMPRLLRL